MRAGAMPSSNANAANYCCSNSSEDAREEADAAFKQAIDIAADQGAKMLELRASAALARLWARCGERKKALDVLTPIYGWFTQGLDTPDLHQARTLLGELRTLQH